MSKRLLFIIAALLFVSAGAFAQVGGYSSTATDTTGKRLSLPTVKVCADALCSTTATIYKDAAKTAQANPFTGDAQGNYSFFAAPGNYFVQVAKAGYGTLTTPASIGGVGDVVSSANNVLTGNNTHGGTETFTGTTTVPTPVNATDASRKDYTDGPAPFAGLTRALSAGLSAAMQWIGDSTGNETGEHIYLLGQWLASQYPNFTVKYRLWNDTNQNYDPPTFIQTGPAGELYANFTGVSGMTASPTISPYVTISDITGDLDIVAKIQPSSYRPAAAQTIIARMGNAPARSFRFQVAGTTGQLLYSYSTTGSDLVDTFSSVALPDVGAAPTWVRVTDQAAAGTITFSTSNDGGATWTTLGTVRSVASHTIFNPAGQAWEIGARNTSSDPLTGRIYYVEVRQGVNGVPISPLNIDGWRPEDTTSSFVGSPELQIMNGSQPGSGLAYWTDATRIQKATPPMTTNLATIVSLSHNELNAYGATEMNLYGSLFSTLRSRLPNGHLIVETQNPRTSPAVNITEHAIRRAALMSWSNSPVGYDVIDTYGAFLNDSRWASSPSTLVFSGDGIHPTNGVNTPGNSAGELLWVGVEENAWLRSENSQSPVYASVPAPLAGITTSTGTGSAVLSDSPTLTTSATVKNGSNTVATIDGTNGIRAFPTGTATSGANFASQPMMLSSSYWNGAAAATANWRCIASPASGTNPAINLQCQQVTGTPGAIQFFDNSIQQVPSSAATSGANVNGAAHQWSARYWTGAASAVDTWSCQNNMGTGSNPTSTFNCTHSGTPGASTFQVPALHVLAGVMQADNGVAPSGTGNVLWTAGAGAPAAGNCTTAKGGSLYSRTDGTTTTTLYVCDGSTGVWTAK